MVSRDDCFRIGGFVILGGEGCVIQCEAEWNSNAVLPEARFYKLNSSSTALTMYKQRT